MCVSHRLEIWAWGLGRRAQKSGRVSCWEFWAMLCGGPCDKVPRGRGGGFLHAMCSSMEARDALLFFLEYFQEMTWILSHFSGVWPVTGSFKLPGSM